LIVISTSGNSENIKEVLKLSKKKKIFSIAFLGSNGGKAKELSDLNLIVPSSKVSKIQECHIFIGHFILNRVEEMLFPYT
jgi:D-sedoheptulose 7-phosphate isomerase